METFYSLLRQSLAKYSNRTAIVMEHQTWSYGQLDRAAERTAALIQSRGVAAGDRVILLVRAKGPFLLGYLGAIYAGAVPVPLNPDFKLEQISYFVHDCSAKLLVYDSPVASLAAAVHQLRPDCALVEGDELFRPPGSQTAQTIAPRADDPALILYSSGTTGEPKGVVHSHNNLACAVQAIIEVWRFTPHDVLANVLPLFHIHGLSFATNVSLLSGSTMLVADHFHPVETLKLLDRATVFMGVPPFYYSFLKRDEFRRRARHWNQLRLVTCGSAPIRAEVLPELEAILERPVINRYGMTECHVLTSLPLEGAGPHGSVGMPLRGIEVSVRGADARRCDPGEIGKVWARGPNLFREYWQRPDETAESFDAEEWFDTGDVGQFDQHGFLTLVGRSKELIIVGGFNVYPAVVERVLNECPGVRESAVIGVPDANRGERVAAVVVADDPSLDAQQLRRLCRERLADYQCPTMVEIVPELPRNALGKVLKRELRERYARS